MTWVWIAGALLFFVGVLLSIALHEVGHMVPAKLFGVKVTQYMVGFGRTLWSRKKGDTEYGIKAFPFGGYVRMIGMLPPGKDGKLRSTSTGPFQNLIQQARQAEHEDLQPGDENHLFYKRKWWQKVIIMSGGPLMNLFLAFVFFGIVLVGFGTTVSKLEVASVSECVIPAKEQRDKCKPTDPEAPAAAAGFKVGDKLLAFNGKPIGSWEEMTESIRAAGANQVTVTVERDGKRLQLNPTPISTWRPKLDNPTKYEKAGFLGVGPVTAHERQSPLAVFPAVGGYISLTAEKMIALPDRIVAAGRAALGAERELDTPMSVVGASRLAGDIAVREDLSVSARIATFFQFLGALNLFMCMFNFIPLLPLDGGHIAGALLEGLKRAFAKIFRRPDPGYVDIAKALPLTYALAAILIVTGVMLVYADLFNPIRLPN